LNSREHASEHFCNTRGSSQVITDAGSGREGGLTARSAELLRDMPSKLR